ncbi:MAG: hypothetical protein HN578_00150 [Rhodospirillales bacterium]|jgi:hypothetical protein|nr:hypothetical protein [Rhodospirillales bacterium]
MTRLRPFSRAVLVRRRFESDNLATLGDLGDCAVGAEISNFNAAESKIMALMVEFNGKARKFGFATYVHGLGTISPISAAAGAGFKFVDGDTIMSIFDMPQSVAPFDVEQLYAPLLAAEG